MTFCCLRLTIFSGSMLSIERKRDSAWRGVLLDAFFGRRDLGVLWRTLRRGRRRARGFAFGILLSRSRLRFLVRGGLRFAFGSRWFLFDFVCHSNG
jgi:hypothetical protein